MDKLGEIKYNNFGSKMEIIEYDSYSNITILFPKYGWTCKNRYDHFKNGEIKCPYEPRYYSKGYLGEGEYNIKNGKSFNQCYISWRNMLKRCYDKELHLKEKTYEKCEVCEEWLCFQNFAEWYEDNFYQVSNEKMQLDKDILYKGNKVYSPKTCIFVPQRINKLFTKNDKSRGEYPIGLSYDRSRNKIAVQCNDGVSVKKIGRFNTNQMQEAFQLYKEYKERVIKEVADEYKLYIPKELYEAMYRYEVEIDD